MLTREEEYSLDNLIRSLKVQENIAPEKRAYYYFDLEQSLWLTKKLKEINDECSKYAEELQSANEDNAKLREIYEN